MPEVRISDASLLPDLLEELEKRIDTVVAVVGPNTVEVSVLGSYSQEGMRLAVELRVRAWEAVQRAGGREVTVVV